MRRVTAIALLTGLAALAAAVAYAGAGAVARALQNLRLSGLLLLILAHLPAVVLMGAAWWLASGARPPARLGRFLWARAVRDAAAETLPFLQFGGVIFGVRALGRGPATAVRGAAAAAVDGLIELAAKLPYVAAALLALLALAPHTRLEHPLLVTLLWAFVITAAVISIPFIARRTLGRVLERALRAASSRLPAMLALDEHSIGDEIRASFSLILQERRRLWAAFSLHLACWLFGAAEVWLALRLLGWPASVLQALAMDGAIAALRTFGLLVPGAAGIQEASYLAVAAVLGIPPATAVAAALARRARDLALGMATLGVAVSAGAGFAALSRPGRAQQGPGSCSPQQGTRAAAASAVCAAGADGQQCSPPGVPVQAHHERR